MKQTSQFSWLIVCWVAVFLAILTFTPLILPAGQYKPMLFGMPYSLWSGIIIAMLFITLTFIGTRVHPSRFEEEGK